MLGFTRRSRYRKDSKMLALAIINVVATITSIALYLSPYPDFREIHMNKSTGEVRVLPVLMLFCNSVMWALYGLASEIFFPVMSINVFGMITTITFSSVFYRWSTERAVLNKMAAVTGLGLLVVLTFTVLAMISAIPVSSNVLVLTLGYGAVAVNICLYAAPLQTMTTVLSTKSSASIPLTMCVVNLINSSLWLSYAVLSNNMFILVPNSLGVILSVVQVTLGIKYRPKKEVEMVSMVEVVVKVDKGENVEEVHTRGSLSLAKSEVSLAVSCANAVAIDIVRSTSYKIAETPQIA
ncbi:hypothetical protein BBO99_00005275 [Phytophthora kernoviae]|uniref:Sugar transporter SWEET1 n=3 Tax=Phytophthora kernoviae TaxID=325452 RepID=A0A421GP37_9STRA|nr:hypothetical protein G195_006685 [Phytophthora kernoviae 00238/432]KAG2523075.1 hypothetical protein JM16_004831 [Phytophthora kernoviae]RLN06503.1 hypothetical protein BBI17_004608 [Phytophthora kernoviae]RLN79429.1 hypothetical protein BBO99_00005275 [Phytophthora kernoviae]